LLINSLVNHDCNMSDNYKLALLRVTGFDLLSPLVVRDNYSFSVMKLTNKKQFVPKTGLN